MRLRAWAAVVLLALLALPTATAHANFLRSDPEPGSRLDEAPTRVTVVLTERLDPRGSGLVVRNADGEQVDNDDLVLENGDRPVLSVTLPADLPEGAYTIRWHALSTVDQHTTSGTVGFAVGGFEPPQTQQTAGDVLDPPSAAARSLQYAGFALALGGAVFLAYIDRGQPNARRDRALGHAIGAGALLHALGVLLLANDARADSGFHWRTFFASDIGPWFQFRMLVAALAFLLAVPFWLGRARMRAWAPWSVAAMLVAAVGSSRFGHASQHGPFAIALDYVHFVAIGLWLGGLVLLLTYLLRWRAYELDVPQVRAIGLRFSHIAITSVILLTVTGFILWILIVGMDMFLDPGRLLTTAWGRALAGKILLLVGMVFLASLNRYVFLDDPHWRGPPMVKRVQGAVGRLTRGRAQPLYGTAPDAARPRVRSFSRTVAVEAALGAGVLILAGLLTSVGAPTPTDADGNRRDGLRLTGEGDEFLATMFLDPEPRAGAFSTSRFYLESAQDQEPVANNSCGRDDCLYLFIASADDPDAGEERRTARAEGDGWWTVRDILFVQAGNATLRLEVQTAYVYLDEIYFDVTIPS